MGARKRSSLISIATDTRPGSTRLGLGACQRAPYPAGAGRFSGGRPGALSAAAATQSTTRGLAATGTGRGPGAGPAAQRRPSACKVTVLVGTHAHTTPGSVVNAPLRTVAYGTEPPRSLAGLCSSSRQFETGDSELLRSVRASPGILDCEAGCKFGRVRVQPLPSKRAGP